MLLTKHFVVQVDADHRIGTKLLGPLQEFLHGDIPGALQRPLVGCRAAADQVAYAGKKIVEQVGAQNGLACHYATVSGYAFAFN